MGDGSKPSNGWVLITGASKGIGEVFAQRLAQDGWNLVLVARTEHKLKELAERLKSEYQVNAQVISADLEDSSAPQQIYDELAQNRIPIEGLINNAGFGFGGRFNDVSRKRYLGMIDVNIRALVELTHLFLSDMIKRKSGFIINVSSTASYQPLPYSSVYAASKSFVTSFTEALWLETQNTGVRVLNLCPGLTKTSFGTSAGLRDFYQDPWAEKPEAVVETAMRALKRNKPTAVSGFRNRFLLFLERLFPHDLLLLMVLFFQNSRRKV